MNEFVTNQSETVIRADDNKSVSDLMLEVWSYRILLWVFAFRDVKVKYAQTIFGFIWLVLSPLITVGVFTFVFGLMVKVPTGGLPYLLFYLVAIVPWYAFISTFNLTIGSIDGNVGLVTKVYFPRLLLGGSYAISAAVDYLVGFGLINIFALVFHLWNVKLLIMMPILFAIQAAFGLGLGYLLVPLATRYRDVKHVVPLCIQLYYYANPILYPVSAAPRWTHLWYNFNPLSAVITSYRSILLGEWPNFLNLGVGMASAMFMLVIGTMFFNKHEKNLVDLL